MRPADTQMAVAETREIWKFPLEITDEQNVLIPSGAEILCVQIQNDKPCIWAIVEPQNVMRSRRFYIVGTGHQLPHNFGRYVGTVQQMRGMLVWHVFEDDE